MFAVVKRTEGLGYSCLQGLVQTTAGPTDKWLFLLYFFFPGPLAIHLKQCTCSLSDKICPKQLDHCILADPKYNGGVTSYFSLPLGLEADSFVRLLTLPFEDVE